MNNRGLLVVVSGFSGAGKGTIMKELVRRYDRYALSISATTREPRKGETHGREYFFKTRDEFISMIESDELIEYAEYVNNFYGTPYEYVFQKMEEGKDVILEIEIQGALKVKEKYPETVLIFVMPPSAKELKERLIGRGTENMEVIEARLKRAVEESDGIESYDFIVVNNTIDECVLSMHGLIQGQHSKASNNLSFIKRIKEELTKISGGI